MPLPVIFDSIPEEIKRFPNWVLWRLEERDGKYTKIPYQRNGKKADTTNPDTWDKYNYIESTRVESDGVGFVFSEDTGIIGIDWDKVRDPETGEWDEEILEEIKSLNSYAELSQSGTGAHVLIKGTIPGTRRRKGNIEMYSKERFFVVTGQNIEGTPKEIKENQEAINKLYDKRFGSSEQKKTESGKKPDNKIKLSDSEIIDIASKAKNSEKFNRLFNGDTSGYKSDSDADMALCSLLAFYTQDPGQIDSIFRSSGLHRDKWERADYRDRTINTALQGVTETYNPEKKGKGKSVRNILSSRGREVLNLAFKKMLEVDSDQARQKNGEGFNKFDSEAIHEDMDGKEEVPDNVLIKHAHRLKKYKKQLTEFGIDINEMEDIIKEANDKQKSTEVKKVNVHFDEVADQILKDNHIFSMRDNGQIYLYKDGVYRSEGTEAILGTQIRDVYNFTFIEKWKDINPDFDLPEHIPKATAKYVSEVLEYIKAYTHMSRNDIDGNQDRYINFKNGLFDLEEWKLIEHDPEILNIAQIQAIYDPAAKCPVITRYFKDCELPEESIKVLEEFAGYCLTTDVKLQKAVMLYGNGANGKSVFINLLKIILGKDCVSGESLQNLETDKYRVANLYGKRLNAFPDLKDSPLQTNEVFNTLTGNDLELIGERKYQHDFRFKPTAKLLFSANKIPFAYSDNYAYYRRWILIEFPKTFEKDEIDESIIEKMTTEEEKSGFINLMLEGLKRLLQNRRFSYDLGVDEIEKQYLLHSDNVQIFEETCLRDCEGTEKPNSKKEVYDYYLIWCNFHKINPVKPKTFTKKLDKIGRKVYNTSTYNPETKKGEWFSCYYNTRLTINYRPAKNKVPNTTQTNIQGNHEEERLENPA